MRFVLIVEYDGTNYHGFQYQKNFSSIQEELEKAVKRLTNESPRVNGAGRTDAGVHAAGQVVAFDISSPHVPEVLVNGLNFYLPKDISVKAAYRVEGDFDPRRMALSRRYRYTLLCGRSPSPLNRFTAHHIRECLNLQKMRQAAEKFEGKHDFACFASAVVDSRSSTVREIYEVEIHRDGNLVCFDVEGNAFLTRQVRRMVGALIEIGVGRMSMSDLISMIECRPMGVVAHTLPARGLCLLGVKYESFPPKVG